MSEEVCPACGNPLGGVNPVKYRYTPLYGPTVPYLVMKHTCLFCTETFPVEGQGSSIAGIMAQADRDSVSNILDRLNTFGYSNSYLERVLHLPYGILNSWKTIYCTPEGLALLRLVVTNPKLLSDLRCFSCSKA